jgi:polyhydroxybutyrate depolymerase
MRAICLFLGVSLLLVGIETASAQAIDVGRGEIPLVLPSGYDAENPAPLVVLIHGYTSSGARQDALMKISAQADSYGFLFVAPDGTREASGEKHPFWNATDACCDFQGSGVDDSAYLLSVIDEVKKHYSVDANRVYLIGHSNGGFMCHRMAQDHPDTIAAVASMNGAAPNKLKGTKPRRPVNILHIHGTKDRLNAYEGGDIRGVPYPGPVEGLEKWAEFLGGSKEVTTLSKRLNLDTNLEGNETTITQYMDGSLELWTINGGGHVPAFPEDFAVLVIEWLMAHPKTE